MNLMDIVNRAAKLQNDAERVAFLDQAFAGQPELRKELEQLLAYLIQVKLTNNDKAVAQQPPTLPEGSVTADYVPKVNIGSVIAGKYKIREQLGEGGMGTVYIVDTVRDVKTSFALKLIKSDYASHQVIARFEQERQALALMNHPNIAKFIDAGTSETGQPYFVMEHIKGLPITKFCDQEKLTVEERLRLFQSVCHAVQHAHMKGIIHRDLKPGNILVTYIDGVPVPKVIDFGVAKATLQPLTDKTIHSEINSIIGTLEYMAPEQAEVNSLDIDTRADIYALGVILYELLTGAVPFSRKELGAAAMLRMLEMIRLEEPAKPSTKLSHSGSLPSVAATRKIDPAMLMKKLRGEIDWIIMKCLEKERGRRYQGPNQLANDIDNYLHDLPLVASPPSKTYRLKKFVRRHRGKVLAASVLVLSLVGGIVGTSWGMMKAVKAEGEAKREAATAKATKDFVENDILQQVDHYVQANAGYLVDKDIKLVTLLDRAAERIDKGSLSSEPLVLASIELTIGKAYLATGFAEKALSHLKKSVELRINQLGKSHEQTLQSRYWLCKQLSQMSKHKEAIVALKELMADINQHDSNDTLLIRNTQYSLAHSLEKTSQYEEAKQLFNQVHQERSKELGENHYQSLMARQNVANCFRQQSEYKEAERIFLEVIQKQRAFLTKNHPDLLVSMNNLAAMYSKQQDFKLAEEMYLEIVQIAKGIYPKEHPVFLMYLSNLAAVQGQQGKTAESIKTFQELYELYKIKLGAEHDFTLTVLYNIAASYFKLGDLALAEDYYLLVLAVYEKKYGPYDTNTLKVYRSLSLVKERQQDLTAAEQFAVKTLAGVRHQKSRDPVMLFIELLNVTAVKLKLNKTKDAATLLQEAAALENSPNLEPFSRANYHRLLGQTAMQQEMLEEARKQLLEAVALIKTDKREKAVGSFAAQERAFIRAAVQALFEKTGKKDKGLETVLSELK